MTTTTSSYQGKIKIFSDGADRGSMLEMAAHPLIHGLTTNPTLMKKAGITDYRSFCKDILRDITNKPISFEVFADDLKEMERQALEIASWGENVYVKIPVTNSHGEKTTGLVKHLAQKGVKQNVTALLTVNQVYEIAHALKDGPACIVSVFAGRIADTGRDPIPLMQAAAHVCAAFGSHVELLWASSREVLNIVQAEVAGCQIITCTADLIKKMGMFNKDLTQLSLETVRMFKTDAESAGFKL